MLEIKIIQLNERLRQLLPESYKILSEANLTVHPYVTEVLLEGSRGPSGGYRADSDIDLSLLVDMEMLQRPGNHLYNVKQLEKPRGTGYGRGIRHQSLSIALLG